MTNVLWLSRHDMTSEQLEGLKRVVNDEVTVKKVDETVKSAADVLKHGEDCDVLAVVLPPHLLADLFAMTAKKIIVAKSKRIRTATPTGTDINFVYDGWEVIDQFIYRSHIVK